MPARRTSPKRPTFCPSPASPGREQARSRPWRPPASRSLRAACAGARPLLWRVPPLPSFSSARVRLQGRRALSGKRQIKLDPLPCLFVMFSCICSCFAALICTRADRTMYVLRPSCAQSAFFSFIRFALAARSSEAHRFARTIGLRSTVSSRASCILTGVPSAVSLNSTAPHTGRLCAERHLAARAPSVGTFQTLYRY